MTAAVDSRRILITGLSSYWGGRLAQALEREPEVDAIIGVDTSEPRHELDRTEFVRVGIEQAPLRRIMRAAAIDTVIDTRLVDDSSAGSLEQSRQTNVDGTRSLLAACSDADATVHKLVLKASARRYGSGRHAPAFLTEEMAGERRPSTSIERDLAGAEEAVAQYGARHPGGTVTVLRFADAIGPGVRGSHMTLLGLPVIPAILGFDPRLQFIHEDDVVGVLAHAAVNHIPGTYNAAADGVLALSEIASALGKPLLPVLPPWGTILAAAQLRRLGVRVPLEALRTLRHGRGLDNRRLKATGYLYRYTTREAVLKLRAHQRLRPLLRSGGDTYRYDREVEEFLRRSPSVQSAEHKRRDPTGAGDNSSALGYDSLSAAELIELISSLEPEDLTRLREHEAANLARSAVLEALDRHLARIDGG